MMSQVRWALLLQALPVALPAQAPVLELESRVRVMKQSDRYEKRRIGRVLSVGRDSAVVRFETVRVPTETFALTRLERWSGTRTRSWEGALIGAGVGVGLGFMLSNFLAPTGCNDWCLSRPEVQGKVVPASGIVFLLIGRAIGKHHRADRWTPVIK